MARVLRLSGVSRAAWGTKLVWMPQLVGCAVDSTSSRISKLVFQGGSGRHAGKAESVGCCRMWRRSAGLWLRRKNGFCAYGGGVTCLLTRLVTAARACIEPRLGGVWPEETASQMYAEGDFGFLGAPEIYVLQCASESGA
jgi:hypothetical protein